MAGRPGRAKSVVLAAGFLVVLALTVLVAGGSARVLAAVPPGSGLVYVEGDRLMVDGEPFVMKGYNYFPRDYGWTAMAHWDWDEVDAELALAAQYGANTIRTGMDYPYLTGNFYTKPPTRRYQVPLENLDAIERFLSIAAKHGLKVVY